MDKKTLKRKNVYVSADVNAWLEEESERTGMSQSAIMLNAINVYMRQTQLPGQLSTIQDLMKKLEENEKKTTK